MSSGVIIALLPDDTYVQARPKVVDPHLTVAYFGSVDLLSQDGRSRLGTTINVLRRSFAAPIRAKANGVGLFDAGQDGFAKVDLIDGIEVFRVRLAVELLFQGNGLDGVTIDYTHGFTPHMTREFLSHDDEFYAVIGPEEIDNLSFTFDRIGLWCGDERYQVTI